MEVIVQYGLTLVDREVKIVKKGFGQDMTAMHFVRWY
jgi:hypothetical protein